MANRNNIRASDAALQALGEKPLNDINKDGVLVVADARRASATSCLALALVVHGARFR
jgi:hypothetical protein